VRKGKTRLGMHFDGSITMLSRALAVGCGFGARVLLGSFTNTRDRSESTIRDGVNRIFTALDSSTQEASVHAEKLFR
jgi:hypothetical protein